MEHCPRCSEVVEPGWAYCPLCGRSRILESLRSPSRVPQWHREVVQGLIKVFAIWFVVTFAVAFFREAKVVRDARQTLAEVLEDGFVQQPETDMLQASWQKLEPFLNSHANHEQALILCARLNVELSNPARAAECLNSAPEIAVEVSQSLGSRFGQRAAEKITEKTSDRPGCHSSAFQEWFELAAKLGEDKVKDVEQTLFTLIPACYGSENLPSLAAFLAGKNRAMDMVHLGFVPLIEQADTWQARQIAEEAVRLVPEGKEAVDAALERRRARN